MREERMDILIRGGTLLSMGDSSDPVEDPLIGIKNGVIAFIEKGDRTPDGGEAGELIDASGSLILPGLINTHTHLPMVCFRGMADDLPLMEWLQNHIFPAEAKYVNKEMVYHSSMLAMAEMMLSGTTTFCDGYFFESAIARAAIEAGMRAVVCQGFIDFPTADNPDPAKNCETAERFVRQWRGVSERVTPALFCHAPYTCSPATLVGIKEIARHEEVLYLTHLSETITEVRDIKDRYGRTPVHHLHELGVLDEKTVAVHCVWIDDEEIDVIADCGVKVSHTPESNMKLATGGAPIPALLEKGVVVGLGTDGCASNNDLDLFSEMGTAARLHKLECLDPTVMNARETLEMATMGGARVLGLEHEIGSIEPGKRADIILVDRRKPHLTPLYNAYSHLVYAASGSDVTTVIIDGKVVVRDRHMRTMNIDNVMERVRKIAGAIRRDREG